jgi:hypothetical protein
MTPQEKAALEIVLVVGDAIKELGSVPSGHLYAQLMGRMSLDSYNKIIGMLKNAKVIKEEGHLLTYIGPKE